jgi:uncharacterized protein
VFGLFKKKPQIEVVEPKARRSSFDSTWGDEPTPEKGIDLLAHRMAEYASLAPHVTAKIAMDSACEGSIKSGYSLGNGAIPDALAGWFLNQTFIGHQMCGILLQNWLIQKACYMPGRDATRNGYRVVSEDGGDLDDDIVKRMKLADRRYKIDRHLVDFIGKGRAYGIRVAKFEIDGPKRDEYYKAPFNPDGVTPGSYRGIVQVDPQWCSPVMDSAGAADPASMSFYEPTWWMIGGKLYHKTHLVIYRNGSLPDTLKPLYQYGGLPLTQQIMERVYCAERTANEAPLLAMDKRLTIFGTNMEEAKSNWAKFTENLARAAANRDNSAILTFDKEGESVAQIDTSLADLDAVIASQYQIVAAIANVPATKLMGTSPKGFGASGDYEISSYHQALESVQAGDATDMLERHHLLVMRSEVAPSLPDGKPLATSVIWEPLDTPTAKELAETDKFKADTDAVLASIGAIDGIDVRDRIRAYKDGGYYGILKAERPEQPIEQEDPYAI